MLRWVLAASLLASVATAGSARADRDPPTLPPPPRSWDRKRPLDADDLARKKERSYLTGLPLANFDSNTGFGAGLRGYYYYNGKRSDPLFAYTPYLHRLFVQVFATTRGLSFHWLDWDAPAIAGTPYRLRLQAIYMRNTGQNYFGLGSAAHQPLTFPGADRTYEHMVDYQAALDAIGDDGTTLARYDQYDIRRPILVLGLERTFLRGLVRSLLGVAATHTSITDYSGKTVDGVDASGDRVPAIMGTTRLSLACQERSIDGCAGGRDNFLRLGLSVDTRDFEPDPNRGLFADVAVDLSTAGLGSEYDYVRLLTSVRYFWSPIPRRADLVLGGRATFVAQSRGVPFFSMNTLPYTDDPRTGLGGLRTLRGFRQDRFVGPVMALLNLELRWTYFRFQWLRQKFALMATLFVDQGRVFDELDEVTWRGFERGQGVALRVSWNQATIVTAEYGVSGEDTGVYVNFNHQF